MKNKNILSRIKKFVYVFGCLILLSYFAIAPRQAEASFLGDVWNGIIKIVDFSGKTTPPDGKPDALSSSNTAAVIASVTSSDVTRAKELSGEIFKVNADPLRQQLLLNLAIEREALAKELMRKDPALFLSLAIKASQRNLLPLNIQPYIEKETTLTSKIEVIHIDDFDNPQNSRFDYFLKDIDGKTKINFYPTDPLYLVSGSVVKASGFKLGDNFVSRTNKTNFSVQETPALESIGDQKTLVILLDFANSPATHPFTKEKAYDLVFNDQFQEFYKEQSYNQVSFSGEVVDWYKLNRDVSSIWCPAPTNNELGQIIKDKGINLANYKRVVFLPNTQDGGGWSGVGTWDLEINGISYKFSEACIGIYLFDKYSSWGEQPFEWKNFDYITSHEMGHSLGLNHANGWDCGDKSLGDNCTHREYGNYFDTMGTISRALHFNAFYKEVLGWIKPSQVLEINQSGTYSINTLEKDSAIKFAKISNYAQKDTPYYLEYRKAFGFDSKLKEADISSNQNGLFINKAVKYNGGNMSRLIDASPTADSWWDDTVKATLNENATFADPDNGITIDRVSNPTENSIDFRVTYNKPSDVDLTLDKTSDGNSTVKLYAWRDVFNDYGEIVDSDFTDGEIKTLRNDWYYKLVAIPDSSSLGFGGWIGCDSQTQGNSWMDADGTVYYSKPSSGEKACFVELSDESKQIEVDFTEASEELDGSVEISADPDSVTYGGKPATLTWTAEAGPGNCYLYSPTDNLKTIKSTAFYLDTNSSSRFYKGPGYYASVSRNSSGATANLTTTTYYTLTCDIKTLNNAKSYELKVDVTDSEKFIIGDLIYATDNVNVRDTSSLSEVILGRQSFGSLGKVVGGPARVGNYSWWMIDYNNAPDGWSAENYLEKRNNKSSSSSSSSASSSSGVASETFGYTGIMNKYLVPNEVTSVNIKAYGAQGDGQFNNGGKGGFAEANITVTPGENLYIYVGGQKGWNGGGSNPWGYNGGGASDVRRSGMSLSDRIIVAGGGGGSGTRAETYYGGFGGGFAGEDGSDANGASGGRGATNLTGGIAGSTGGYGTIFNKSTFGVLGAGGDGGFNNCSSYGGGGGGGGGYYGGGGGGGQCAGGATGGGGSSFVPKGGTTLSGDHSGNGQVIITHLFPKSSSSSSSESSASSSSSSVEFTTLLAYYAFDGEREKGSTITYDSSGNDNNGTINGGTTWTEGKSGSGLYYDGIDDYVDLGNPENLQPGKISLSAWFKTDFSGGMIMRKRLYGYGLEMLSSGKVSFWIYNSAAVKFSAISPNVYNDGQWHHATGIYDGSTVKLYIDDSQVASATAGKVYYGTGAIAIGRDGNSSTSYFKGLIDQVRLYNYPLSSSEIDKLYEEGASSSSKPSFSSISSSSSNSATSSSFSSSLSSSSSSSVANNLSNGLVAQYGFDDGSAKDSYGNNNGSVFGAVSSDGKAGGALSFDGVDDYVSLPSLTNTNAYTQSVWIYIRSSGGYIFANDAGAYWCNTASTAVWMTRITSSCTSTRDDLNLPALTLNQWTHFVFVYDGVQNIKRIYKDGVLSASKTPSHGAGSLALAGKLHFIGDSNDGATFNGIIDEVKIYNRALTAEEVSKLYSLPGINCDASGTCAMGYRTNWLNQIGAVLESISQTIKQIFIIENSDKKNGTKK